MGHNYSQWQITKQATCAEEGSKTRSCSRCTTTETQSIPTTDHTYSYGRCTVCDSAQPASEGLKFELSYDGKSYYVAGWKSYSYFSTKFVVIPDSYNGKPVTGITESAFTASDMEEIILPNTIIEIESLAFYGCENLKTIRIPDSVTSIGSSAFSGCDSLETVYINTTGWKRLSSSVDFSDPYEAAYILRNYGYGGYERK